MENPLVLKRHLSGSIVINQLALPFLPRLVLLPIVSHFLSGFIFVLEAKGRGANRGKYMRIYM